MIVDFRDAEDIYGRIKIDKKDLPKVKQLTEEYKRSDENYDVQGLYAYLKAKGIVFEEVPLEGDVYIYF